MTKCATIHKTKTLITEMLTMVLWMLLLLISNSVVGSVMAVGVQLWEETVVSII